MVLRFPSAVLIPLSAGSARGLRASTTLGIWMLRPAAGTAAKCPSQSLVTMDLGSNLALAHLAIDYLIRNLPQQARPMSQ